MELDLIELGRRADCDPRTLIAYFSRARDRMRPRVRARIEPALVAMGQGPNGALDTGSGPPQAA